MENETTTPVMQNPEALSADMFIDVLDQVWPDHTPTQRRLATRLKTSEGWNAANVMAKISELRGSYATSSASPGTSTRAVREPEPALPPLGKSDTGSPVRGPDLSSTMPMRIGDIPEAMILKMHPREVSEMLDRQVGITSSGSGASIIRRAAMEARANRHGRQAR